MPETTTERLAALVGVVAAVVLLFVALSAKAREGAVPVAAPAAAETEPAKNAPSTEPTITPVATRPNATNTPRPGTARLVLAAARGDCWLSVRAGSAEGEVLYEGVLVSGKTLPVKGARLWLRLGAAANLDLSLNGKRVAALPAGTVDLVVTPQGVRPTT
jgi:hypothetical protein